MENRNSLKLNVIAIRECNTGIPGSRKPVSRTIFVRYSKPVLEKRVPKKPILKIKSTMRKSEVRDPLKFSNMIKNNLYGICDMKLPEFEIDSIEIEIDSIEIEIDSIEELIHVLFCVWNTVDKLN